MNKRMVLLNRLLLHIHQKNKIYCFVRLGISPSNQIEHVSVQFYSACLLVKTLEGGPILE